MPGEIIDSTQQTVGLGLHEDQSFVHHGLNADQSFAHHGVNADQGFVHHGLNADQGFAHHVLNEVYTFAENHPKTTGAIAAAATLSAYLLLRGRGAAVVGTALEDAGALGKTGAEVVGAGVTGESAVLARTIEGTPIPDVPRPALTLGGLDPTSSVSGFRDDLVRLYQLPRSITPQSSITLGKLSEDMLSARAPITGERLSEATILTEQTRIGALNPEISGAATDLIGQNVTVYDAASLSKLADQTQFRFVPQIGQFLKAGGTVTEEQIGKALELQKAAQAAGERKLIGQILVDEGFASKESVDAAFESQQAWKKILEAAKQPFVAPPPP